ncbi:YfgM family protein [Avibacterium gallinarum]|uniref:YfgM family protein n=1 Tax=Avibacterium gallinarum TaxID=755 RepID=UPI003BF8928D
MAYSIEEEQELNELKTWWKENGKLVVAIFVLTLAGVFGWRYWQSHQIAQNQQRSAQYEQLVSQFQADKSNMGSVEQFAQSNDKTAYAVFALLDAASISVQKQDFTQAENLLKQALANADDDILRSVSALRLAAVQFQKQQFDNALASLDQVKGDAWNSAAFLLKGDIQLANGDKESAKASFEQGLKNASPVETDLIQVRLNNL